MRILPLMLLVGLAGCVPKSVNQRIEALEMRVAQLETRPNVASRPDVAAETAARDAINEIRSFVSDDPDFGRAGQLCEKATAAHGQTQAWRRGGQRLCDEVAVVGKPEGPWQVETWFQGGQPAAADAKLLVFWEQWCPHCKREVPELQGLHQRWQGRLEVVGLTKVNRSSTDEKVVAFIAEKGLTYAMAKEDRGAMSRYYAVTGVPAAALVSGGEVVWRGHPARLNDDLIEALLARRPGGKNR